MSNALFQIHLLLMSRNVFAVHGYVLESMLFIWGTNKVYRPPGNGYIARPRTGGREVSRAVGIVWIGLFAQPLTLGRNGRYPPRGVLGVTCVDWLNKKTRTHLEALDQPSTNRRPGIDSWVLASVEECSQ